jgi:hypothetical protein
MVTLYYTISSVNITVKLLRFLICSMFFLSACKTLKSPQKNALIKPPPAIKAITYEEFLRSLSHEQFEIYIKNLYKQYNFGPIYPIKKSTQKNYI